MGALTPTKQETFPIPGPGERYIEYTQLPALSGTSPDTFTSSLAKPEMGIAEIQGTTLANAQVSISGSTVTVTYSGNSTGTCFVMLLGRRES